MESYRRQGSKKLIWQKIEQKINNISYTFFFFSIFIYNYVNLESQKVKI